MGHFDSLKMKNHERPKEAILVQTYSATVDLCTRYDRSRKKSNARTCYLLERRDRQRDCDRLLDLFLIRKAFGGVGIVEVANEADARALGTNDPAVKAGLTLEVYPMPNAVVRK